MSARDFAQRVSAYLGQYLPGQRNLSPNTIASYRDMFKLLVTYFGERGRRSRGTWRGWPLAAALTAR